MVHNPSQIPSYHPVYICCNGFFFHRRDKHNNTYYYNYNTAQYLLNNSTTWLIMCSYRTYDRTTDVYYSRFIRGRYTFVRAVYTYVYARNVTYSVSLVIDTSYRPIDKRNVRGFKSELPLAQYIQYIYLTIILQ